MKSPEHSLIGPPLAHVGGLDSASAWKWAANRTAKVQLCPKQPSGWCSPGRLAAFHAGRIRAKDEG